MTDDDALLLLSPLDDTTFSGAGTHSSVGWYEVCCRYETPAILRAIDETVRQWYPDVDMADTDIPAPNAVDFDALLADLLADQAAMAAARTTTTTTTSTTTTTTTTVRTAAAALRSRPPHIAPVPPTADPARRLVGQARTQDPRRRQHRPQPRLACPIAAVLFTVAAPPSHSANV